MSQHTPGPWTMIVGKEKCFHQGNRVAIVHDWQDGEEKGQATIAEVWIASGEQDKADGRLIAQAPAMLALLREVPTTSLSGVQYTAMGRWREKVDALIATLDEPSSQP